MATNKQAQIRYNVLDRCFRNVGRDYTFDDLLDECNEAILETDPKAKGIKRRQLFEDIRFMESEHGWSIELKEDLRVGKKRIYRYINPKFSIRNQPLNETDANLIKAAIYALARMQFDWADELSVRLRDEFKMSEDPKKIIEFEENKFLKGKEFISELYNAILYKKVLKIDYQSFHSEQIQQFDLHPYYLKQFNNRWFLLGRDLRFERLSNLALDRIHRIGFSDEVYQDTDIDFNEYFEDIIGVTVLEGIEPVHVLLKVDNEAIRYIETKAIHGSQKIKERTEKYTLVEIHLIPNYELESRLLSYGEKIEVLEPASLREKLRSRIETMQNHYAN